VWTNFIYHVRDRINSAINLGANPKARWVFFPHTVHIEFFPKQRRKAASCYSVFNNEGAHGFNYRGITETDCGHTSLPGASVDFFAWLCTRETLTILFSNVGNRQDRSRFRRSKVCAKRGRLTLLIKSGGAIAMNGSLLAN
jgi:hypothetical protein